MCSEPCLVHWWRCVNFVHAEVHTCDFAHGCICTVYISNFNGTCRYTTKVYVSVCFLLLTALLHSGHEAGQGDLWGQLDHRRRRRRSHRHWSHNNQAEGAAERQRATEVFGQEERQKTEKRAKGHHREEKIQIEHVAKERGEGRQQKACEQAKIAQKALLSNSFENFQSVFFCAAFFKLGRTGLHLISAWESTSSASVLKIKRKSCSVFNAVKELQSTTQTQKHDSYSCKIRLQEDRYGFSKNLQECSLEQYFWMQFSILAHLHPSLKKPVPI